MQPRNHIRDDTNETTVSPVSVGPDFFEDHSRPKVFSPSSRSYTLITQKYPSRRWYSNRFLSTTNQGPHGWKPMTLQAPILWSLIFISASFIALLEIYSRKAASEGSGGSVFFASSSGTLPLLATFSFLYLPTILAVVYSLLWSWVDLDVKRLEPWFQLSKDGGAQPHDSLFLQYPFDFLPFIPIAAFRRRHWGVSFVGFIVILVFWIVTPLQSAIFNTGVVVRSVVSNMTTSAQLIPLEEQIYNLSVEFQHTAYGIAWLNQSMPPFTTLSYNILPFKPAIGSLDPSSTETWTTQADAYSTTLSCTPANVTYDSEMLTYTFSNGRGCSQSQISSLADEQDWFNYIGYYDSAELDWALENPDCPIEYASTSLAIWGSEASRNGSNYTNLTALFCEPRYVVEKYSVTVNASNLAIVDGTLLDQKLDITSITDISTVFNTTILEYIMSTGRNPYAENKRLPERDLLDQSFRIEAFHVGPPFNPMVGYALAMNPLSVTDLANPDNLQHAFELAHQLLFATAFSSILTEVDLPNDSAIHQRPGLIQDHLEAITLVRPLAVAVEVTLGVILIFAAFLWLYSYSRPSNLKFDPASIGDVMTILHQHSLVVPESQLNSTISNRPPPFYLGSNNSNTFFVRTMENPIEITSAVSAEKMTSFKDRPEVAPAVYPVELRKSVGLLFFVVILLSIIGICFLHHLSTYKDGINLPTENKTILSILENYLPTIFATLLEPMWLILNRVLCLLKPFDELRKGNAKPSASINAKYTSLPPPFVIWRAITSRHFLLAAVCFTTVSTNFLAVSLSTLLDERSVSISWPLSSVALYSPSLRHDFTDSGYTTPNNPPPDHFEIILSNITHNTSLPVWLGKNRYYQPVALENLLQAGQNESNPTPTQFRLTTNGFSPGITCTELSSKDFMTSTSNETMSLNITTTYALPNGTIESCRVGTDWPLSVTAISALPIGNLSFEFMKVMDAPQSDAEAFCSQVLVVGWFRASNILDETQGSSKNSSTSFGSVFEGFSSSAVLACTSNLTMAKFNVVVDPKGVILEADQTSEDVKPDFGVNVTEAHLFEEATSLIIDRGGNLWHNGTAPNNWITALMVLASNYQAVQDPQLSVPSAAVLKPLFEAMYSGLYAALISLNAEQMFDPNEDGTKIQIEAIGTVTRIFVSDSMFKVSVSILGLHLIVAMLYYSMRPKRFLSKMPTTIGVVLGYIDGSRACADFADGAVKEGKGEEERKYSFGRFIGTDGKTKVGIERAERVVLLDNRNPNVKQESWPLTRRKTPGGWV